MLIHGIKFQQSFLLIEVAFACIAILLILRTQLLISVDAGEIEVGQTKGTIQRVFELSYVHDERLLSKSRDDCVIRNARIVFNVRYRTMYDYEYQ